MDNRETVEQYFFKYAFPCSQVLLQLNRINQKDYNKLKEDFSANNPPERRILERVFSAAFKRIERLAERMNKDKWDFEVIREYWESYHDKIIEDGDGIYDKAPESFKDLCKINIAEIVEKKGDMLVVRYSNNETSEELRVVFNDLVKDAKVGDKVRIHYGYAIEKVD